MNYLKAGIPLIFLGLLVALTGCSTSGNTSQSTQSASEEERESMTLDDHLQRINGVTIQGSGDYAKVFVGGARGVSNVSRGMGTPEDKTDINMGDSNQRQPLFVVDGQKAGRDYSNVRDMFSPGEIKSVRLLSDSEASQYGSEGGHGVIAISTKEKADDGDN